MLIRFWTISIYSSWIVIALVLVCSPVLPNIVFLTFLAASFSASFGITAYGILTNRVQHTLRSISIDKAKKIARYCFIAALIVALIGNQHDYILYSKQWRVILSGLDPWIGTGNAYGPVQVAFAPLFAINRVIPKVIFFLVFVLSTYMAAFGKYPIKNDLEKRQKWLSFILFTFCPFSLLTVGVYGNNDAFVAGLMVLSITFSEQLKSGLSKYSPGFLLAIASLVKFYPLVLVPAFVFRKRKIDLNFLCSFLITIATIFTSAYLVWGSSVFSPILFATGRPSKHLSFFNFFRTVLNVNFDHLSVYLVIAVFFVAFILTQIYKMDLIPSTLILFASAITVYKVGNQQYFLFFFSIAPILCRYLYDLGLNLQSGLISSYCFWLGYLNFYQVEYHLTCGMWEQSGRFFRDYGSLGLMISSLYLVHEISRILKSKPMIFNTGR